MLEAASAAGIYSTAWGLNPGQIGELLTVADAPVVGFLKYVLWPVQFRFVRDLVILGAIFVFFCLEPSFMIWWERKIAGRIQSRLGLMRVGVLARLGPVARGRCQGRAQRGLGARRGG